MNRALSVVVLLVVCSSFFIGCTPGIINSPPNPPNMPPQPPGQNTINQEPTNTSNNTGIDDVFSEDYTDVSPPPVPQ
jgi:hypothetical protein